MGACVVCIPVIPFPAPLHKMQLPILKFEFRDLGETKGNTYGFIGSCVRNSSIGFFPSVPRMLIVVVEVESMRATERRCESLTTVRLGLSDVIVYTMRLLGLRTTQLTFPGDTEEPGFDGINRNVSWVVAGVGGNTGKREGAPVSMSPNSNGEVAGAGLRSVPSACSARWCWQLDCQPPW